jgi:predicted RNA-binding Zn ribbon-like protein
MPADLLALPPLVGGWLCLDFANTAEGRFGDHWGEYLGDYPRLVMWALSAGLLTVPAARRLLQHAARAPHAAARVYDRAVALRETIYRTFSAIAHGMDPALTDLDVLRLAFVDALGHAHLRRDGHRFGWHWPGNQDDADGVLWSIVDSAVDLLQSPMLARVKECPGGGETPCTWLFVDTSKNAIRRWCRMQTCGSVAKARRQTARRRSGRRNRASGGEHASSEGEAAKRLFPR